MIRNEKTYTKLLQCYYYIYNYTIEEYVVDTIVSISLNRNNEKCASTILDDLSPLIISVFTTIIH